MAKFRVGCVPYVNAAPLVWRFVTDPASSVEVVFDVPSRLPALHRSGEVEAILVSSIESLRTPGAHVAGGVCVGSNGPVESVRLFSRLPFDQIRTLALDQSSMTSVALAQILLRENYGVKPETVDLPPDIGAMLDECDAAVIIGDKGMTAEFPGARVMDLGQEWTDTTGLPFVWALWTSDRAIDPELAAHLESVGEDISNHLDDICRYAVGNSGWDFDVVRRYLTACVQFPFGASEQKGLQLFGKKLVENEIVGEVHFPNIV